MKTAFRSACYKLNLVPTHAFNTGEKYDTENEHQTSVLDEVVELINNCKEVVTLTKWMKLNNQLESTLQQCVVTRWNSILTTLQSEETNLADLHSHIGNNSKQETTQTGGLHK